MANSTAKVANTLADKLVEIERLRAERENVRQYIIRNILRPHGVTRFHDDLLGVCDQADHISATAFLEGVKAGLDAARDVSGTDCGCVACIDALIPATIIPVTEGTDG